MLDHLNRRENAKGENWHKVATFLAPYGYFWHMSESSHRNIGAKTLQRDGKTDTVKRGGDKMPNNITITISFPGLINTKTQQRRVL